MAKDSSELAKQFIDRSLEKAARKSPAPKPSKAAYTRAVRLARVALEELASVASRAHAGQA